MSLRKMSCVVLESRVFVGASRCSGCLSCAGRSRSGGRSYNRPIKHDGDNNDNNNDDDNQHIFGGSVEREVPAGRHVAQRSVPRHIMNAMDTRMNDRPSSNVNVNVES